MQTQSVNITTIIFDLGNVLIDWNPRYLYRKLFRSEEAVEHFLSRICDLEWNEMQDGGRLISEGESSKILEFPEYKTEILKYYHRWEEMLAGDIPEMVDALKKLKDENSYKLYALTNWSAETWPTAMERFPFLHWFDEIIVSGKEGLRKPDPKIYQLFTSRLGVNLSEALFIDDNYRNIVAAEKLGLKCIHFQNPDQAIRELKEVLNSYKL